MSAILLHPDGSRAEIPFSKGDLYSIIELGRRIGFGHLKFLELPAGYLLAFNPEAEDMSLPFNFPASNMLQLSREIYGSVVIVAKEEMSGESSPL